MAENTQNLPGIYQLKVGDSVVYINVAMICDVGVWEKKRLREGERFSEWYVQISFPGGGGDYTNDRTYRMENLPQAVKHARAIAEAISAMHAPRFIVDGATGKFEKA